MRVHDLGLGLKGRGRKTSLVYIESSSPGSKTVLGAGSESKHKDLKQASLDLPMGLWVGFYLPLLRRQVRRWFEGMRSVVLQEGAAGCRRCRAESIIVLFLGAHVEQSSLESQGAGFWGLSTEQVGPMKGKVEMLRAPGEGWESRALG